MKFIKERNRKMKVAIIGAGYTGMCIGEKLSQNNVKVTIFEKEE